MFLKVVVVLSVFLVVVQVVLVVVCDYGNNDDMFVVGIVGFVVGVIVGVIVFGLQDNGLCEVQIYDDVLYYCECLVYYNNGGDYGYCFVSYQCVCFWLVVWYQVCEDCYDSFDLQIGIYVDGYGNECFCKIC